MKKLSISNYANTKAGSAILISGSARSGTTIIGKVIHSLKGVEYSFEPPALFSLIPLIESIKENNWKMLYETYLYEDFFINSICGRSINCNIADDSSIYKVKSKSSIDARLIKSVDKVKAEKIGADRVIAYKMPDITPFIPKLIEYYPDMRVIFMERGPIETINSLLAKGWFSKNGSTSNMTWPFVIENEIKIPFWVCDKDSDLWCAMSEIDRCAYYYIRVNNVNIPNAIKISYEDLILDPLNTVSELANRLQLDFGPKTNELIGSIAYRSKQIDRKILGKIDSSLADAIMKLPKEEK